jgi:hypothetical protein
MATNDYEFMTRWYLSFLFKPLFRANPRWAMAMGQEGLQKELAAHAAL